MGIHLKNVDCSLCYVMYTLGYITTTRLENEIYPIALENDNMMNRTSGAMVSMLRKASVLTLSIYFIIHIQEIMLCISSDYNS